MSYIVLARKYRPQTFSEIVGQSHITITLENAITKDRVAHAYLFTGSRGVGKTTTARILAKALNCEKGPTTKPCNACAFCNEINQGSSLDVLEIDGASNRGIDEIRNLRDNVKFAPSKARSKIYIIDEVHMLTPEAFNALLKTLEEPPAHVKFIFATTQAHKVPATILSRCQRFDFRRISTKDIVANLTAIARKEHLKASDEVLSLIARHAEGSMRDAEVILDQITSFTQGKAELDDVTQILGIVDEDVLFGLSGAIHAKDPVAALKIIDRLVNDGKDIVQVIANLIEHFRNISLLKISKDLSGLVEVSADRIKEYSQEAAHFTIEEILYIIYTLSNAIDFIRKTNLTKVPFEAAMVKLTSIGSILSLAEISDRIEKLGSPPSEVKITRPVAAPQMPKQDPLPEVTRRQPAVKMPDDPPPAAQAQVQVETKVEVSVAAAGSADLDEIVAAWSRILAHIQTKKISISSYLQEGTLAGFESDGLTISFPKSCKFHKEVLESSEYKRLIEDCIKDIIKRDIRIKFILTEDAGNQSPLSPAAARYAGAGSPNSRARPQEKDVEPIIKAALEIFGGEISKE